MVTAAPGITPPDWSVTTPASELVWAARGRTPKDRATIKRARTRYIADFSLRGIRISTDGRTGGRILFEPGEQLVRTTKSAIAVGYLFVSSRRDPPLTPPG